MKVIDITGWIHQGMWSYCKEYPGAKIKQLPQPEFLKGLYSVYCQGFEIGGQSGTYIETKAHVDKNAADVTEYPASDFFFQCKIIRLNKKKKNEKITADELKSSAPAIEEGDAVILQTGWDEKWFDPDFIDASPFISREAGEWLAGAGIKLLGADFPRFDNPSASEFPWELFWEKVKFLLAPVVNVSAAVKDAVELIALPIKIKGAAAAPARAVLIE